MNKLLIKPTIEEVCKIANEENLLLKQVSVSGGLATAICKVGDKETEKGFYLVLRGKGAYALIDDANALGGDVEHMINHVGGLSAFVVRFDKETYEKKTKEIEAAQKKAQEKEEKERKDAGLKEIQAKKAELDAQEKALKGKSKDESKE